MKERLPDGYVRLSTGGAETVVESHLATAVMDVLRHETLYDFAARHPERRVMHGRLPTYAVPIAAGSGTQLVVRHAHHGGLLARLSGDRFVAPTRAPGELRIALRLRDAGVRTPAVAAYAIHRAGALLRRVDVATHEIPRSRDLAAAFGDPDGSERVAALGATAMLLQELSAAGARHPDLNLKNVLIASGGRLGDLPLAYVLDVDRVHFDTPDSRRIARANFDRLARSARKWRAVHGLDLSDAELEELARAAGVPA